MLRINFKTLLKRIFFVMCMLFMSEMANAQNTIASTSDKKDTSTVCDYILFKNGNEIDAKIIEVNNSEVKYYICNDSLSPVHVILKEDVFMIKYSNGAKEIVEYNPKASKKRDDIHSHKSEYTGSFTWGYGKSAAGNDDDVVNIDFVNSLRLGDGFALGLGIGGRFYDNDRNIIPVYLNIKMEFTQTKVIPFISLGLGHSFDASNQFEQYGLWFGGRLGVLIKLTPKMRLNLDFGGENQFMNSTAYYGSGIRYNPISFNLGISF
jgi:hypothetical protein